MKKLVTIAAALMAIVQVVRIAAIEEKKIEQYAQNDHGER